MLFLFQEKISQLDTTTIEPSVSPTSECKVEQTTVEIVTNAVTTTTVVEVLTSPTPSSPVSPGSPEAVEGSAGKFHSLYEMAMEMIDAHQRNTVCYGEIQSEDVKGDLQDNAQVQFIMGVMSIRSYVLK